MVVGQKSATSQGYAGPEDMKQKVGLAKRLTVCGDRFREWFQGCLANYAARCARYVFRCVVCYAGVFS